MKFEPLHSWNLTPQQAIELQQQLRSQVVRRLDFKPARIKTIAGADCAFDAKGVYGFAGVVVYSWPDMTEIHRVGRRSKVTFPYVPGLLSFRETPLLLAAFDKLDDLPDLIMIDGQGIAHPRRMGIASHIGLWLNRPTIGCAKSRLIGEHAPPTQKPGSTVPLMDGDEQIGVVLRTQRRMKPIYVSIGHRIDLPTAVDVLLRCGGKYRIPIPTRDADLFVDSLKKTTTS